MCEWKAFISINHVQFKREQALQDRKPHGSKSKIPTRQILQGTRKVVLKQLRGRNNSSIILFRYTSLPPLPFPPSSFHPSPFSPVEIPFKCFEGEQMSKTTFQIPMCVLVPVFKCSRGCVRVTERGRRERERKRGRATK